MSTLSSSPISRVLAIGVPCMAIATSAYLLHRSASSSARRRQRTHSRIRAVASTSTPTSPLASASVATSTTASTPLAMKWKGGAMAEDVTDPFDRQRCITGWNQPLVHDQVCMVLGVGGLGSSIAMALARMGVAEIILIDRDTVDVTNLNRQMLFIREQVGQRKVDAAYKTLLAQHLVRDGDSDGDSKSHGDGHGRTRVSRYHMDVMVNGAWSQIVTLARRCHVIFNNIDVGLYFDYATLSLCRSLSIPYASGSSYAWTWQVECYSGRADESSFTIETVHSNGNHTLAYALRPSVIQSLTGLSSAGVPYDAVLPTRALGSSCVVCITASMMVVTAWLRILFTTPAATATTTTTTAISAAATSSIKDSDDNGDDQNKQSGHDQTAAAFPNYTKMDLIAFWEDGDTVTSFAPSPSYWHVNVGPHASTSTFALVPASSSAPVAPS